jgi:phage terminase small subunit
MHAGDDALTLLMDIAFGRLDATSLQLRAAIAAVQYTHIKKHDGGIKDAAQSKAEQAAEGLRPAAAPRLVSNG